MSIKVAEFVTRLEFGGVEAMLLNYTTHFQHPEQFKFHIITQDINDDNCIRQFEDAGYTVHVVTHKRKSIAKNIREVYQVLKQERFDIVHSHMTLTNFYVLFLAKNAWCQGSHFSCAQCIPREQLKSKTDLSNIEENESCRC